MSENDTGQEKTEQATPKRKKESEDKGEVAQSKELNTLLITGVTGLSLVLLMPYINNHLLEFLTNSFRFEDNIVFSDKNALFHIVFSALLSGLEIIAFIAAVSFVTSIFSSIILRGKFTFSSESLTLKLDKLNPITGIKKVISLNGLIEMLKSIAKFSLMLTFSIVTLYILLPDIQMLAYKHVEVSIVDSMYIVIIVFFVMLIPLMIVAGIDVPYQLWSHAKKLKMTRQDIKDEQKQTEGNPQIRSKIREIQRNKAQQKMFQDIPKANVVIVNPEHFAVAVKYDKLKDSAPVVLAKGLDNVAERIKILARKNRIMIYNEPSLARSLYYTTKIGKEIPEGLYIAVAKILAYIYQIENNIKINNKIPKRPDDLEIPKDMRY